jgi:hypothetical protein
VSEKKQADSHLHCFAGRSRLSRRDETSRWHF